MAETYRVTIAGGTPIGRAHPDLAWQVQQVQLASKKYGRAWLRDSLGKGLCFEQGSATTIFGFEAFAGSDRPNWTAEAQRISDQNNQRGATL